MCRARAERDAVKILICSFSSKMFFGLSIFNWVITNNSLHRDPFFVLFCFVFHSTCGWEMNGLSLLFGFETLFVSLCLFNALFSGEGQCRRTSKKLFFWRFFFSYPFTHRERSHPFMGAFLMIWWDWWCINVSFFYVFHNKDVHLMLLFTVH